MTPPTPAVVKAALEMMSTSLPTESHEMISEMARVNGTRPSVVVSVILTGHIRAIAQEMRSVIPHGSKVTLSEAIHASVLNSFANKLEGKQNENT